VCLRVRAHERGCAVPVGKGTGAARATAISACSFPTPHSCPNTPCATGTLPQLPQLSLVGATLRIKGCEKRSLSVESTLLANATLQLLTTAAAGGALLSVVAPNGVTLQLTEAGGVWLKFDRPLCTVALKTDQQLLTSPGVPVTLALDARRAQRVASCLKIPKRVASFCTGEFKARSRASGKRGLFLPGPWSAGARLAVVCDAEAATCT
jgi:hypothetical protein